MTTSGSLDLRKILEILPHRYPFLLVDRIVELDLERGRIVGKKNLTMNEAFFQGHFPGAPLMPGVLILEALAQTGGVLVHLQDSRRRVALLLSVHEAKFRHPAKPGDTLLMEVTMAHLGSRAGRVMARATVDSSLVSEAEMSFALVEEGKI